MRIEREKHECCGCSACASVCPTKAISMVSDEEGFLYPKIDESLCVDCGLCAKSCSFCAEYQRAAEQTPSEYYAVVHQDREILKNSRSGGAFFALAKKILEDGGLVYGVALDERFVAHTVRVDREDDLSSLQGSKYVQSDKEHSFERLAEDLKDGKTVLFSGTACEIAGLYGFLRAKKVTEERLYTCDLVCHGTPSPKIWQDNLAQMEKKLGGRPDCVSFRDKVFGWAPHVESYQKGNKIRYANRYTSVFYADAVLRPSCSNCPFASFERCADMTLADFWGAERLSLPIDLSSGISCLMIHSAKAKKLLSESKGIECFAVDREQIRQPNLRRPTPASSERVEFWADYQKRGYLYASRRFYGLKERLKLVYNYAIRRNKK